MRKTSWCTLVLCLALSSIAARAQDDDDEGGGSKNAQRAAAEHEVKQRAEEFVAAWNKHDPAVLAGFWSDKGDYVGPFGPMASGKEEVAKALAKEQTSSLKGTTYTVKKSSVRFIKKTVALVEFDATIEGRRSASGSALPALPTLATLVFKNTKEGQWHIEAARLQVTASEPEAPAR